MPLARVARIALGFLIGLLLYGVIASVARAQLFSPGDLSGGSLPATTLAGSIPASKLIARASAQSQPSNPTGTTDTTGKMMGLAGAITPTFSGNILFIVSGNIATSTTAKGAKVQLSYGTGTAPVNGAAITGTQCGNRPTFTGLTGVLSVPFSVQCVATGLTLSTAYWLDVTLAAITGNTASISNLSVSAHEF